jgi:D-3-phosphoglycerate dehydrogenase
MSKGRILVCDELSPAAVEIFRGAGFETEVRIGQKEDALVESVAGVHALVVRSATKITRRVIEAASDLRVIGRAGVGVDNVDTQAATERGIVVMNTPDGNTTSAAELAVALLLALARHVPRADASCGRARGRRASRAPRSRGRGSASSGSGIGRAVAARALSLEMKVVARTRSSRARSRRSPESSSSTSTS